MACCSSSRRRLPKKKIENKRLPLASLEGVQQCRCGRFMAMYGHHAATCFCGGSARYNHLRNELFKIAEELRFTAKWKTSLILRPRLSIATCAGTLYSITCQRR